MGADLDAKTDINLFVSNRDRFCIKIGAHKNTCIYIVKTLCAQDCLYGGRRVDFLEVDVGVAGSTKLQQNLVMETTSQRSAAQDCFCGETNKFNRKLLLWNHHDRASNRF